MKPFGIGLKIFSGFMILVFVLIISGILSIFELFKIGSSVEVMLEDNYQSIDAAQAMIEALEREDSGILLLLMGHWKEGRSIVNKADNSFQENLNIASTNITIEGEEELIKKVRESYGNFSKIWEKPIVGTYKERDLEWYIDTVHTAFNIAKQDVEQLMHLNDRALYQTASILKDQSHRSVMPGIISVMSATLFAFVFYYFVNYYIVKPIISINHGIESYIENKKSYNVNVETRDEISELNDWVSNLCSFQRNN
jgi:hypothetical protein